MRRLVFPTAPSPTVTHLMNLVVVILGVTATFVLLFISEPKVNTTNILSQINMNFFELVADSLSKAGSSYIYSERRVWIENKKGAKFSVRLFAGFKDLWDHFNLSCQGGKKLKQKIAQVANQSFHQIEKQKGKT
jgi:hypothetical protein